MFTRPHQRLLPPTCYCAPLTPTYAEIAVPRWALQVKKVFDEYTGNVVGESGQELSVCACNGKMSFRREQAQLVATDGSSKADILVTTPGRLVDHILSTPHFTLEHCRFVVVDEADRYALPPGSTLARLVRRRCWVGISPLVLHHQPSAACWPSRTKIG